MKIKTWIKYDVAFLPTPRCRKYRYREEEDHVEIELKEVSMNELKKAFKVDEKMIYSYGNKLYGPFITEKAAAQKAWDTYKNKNIDIVGIIYEKGKDLNSGLTAQTLLGQVKDFINTEKKTSGGGGGGSSYDPLTVVAKYDTGGYTGSWGSSGRMAMLHQKELVLNAQDTENMLKTVDMVRNIVRVIDLNAGSHSGGLGYIGAAYSGHNAQVIEQEVTIHAEFPNAVNHTEIEMAFDNLINHASQFANRIKK